MADACNACEREPAVHHECSGCFDAGTERLAEMVRNNDSLRQQLAAAQAAEQEARAEVEREQRRRESAEKRHRHADIKCDALFLERDTARDALAHLADAVRAHLACPCCNPRCLTTKALGAVLPTSPEPAAPVTVDVPIDAFRADPSATVALSETADVRIHHADGSTYIVLHACGEPAPSGEPVGACSACHQVHPPLPGPCYGPIEPVGAVAACGECNGRDFVLVRGSGFIAQDTCKACGGMGKGEG